jgi:hypothetical protein
MGVRNLRYLTKILVLTACLIALSGVAAACDCGTKDCTPKSPGYWKTHPEAWPVEKLSCGKIEIGGVLYTPAEAIEKMQMPVKGDKTYTMFDALVAAKLNAANGCQPPCIDGKNIITGANLWIKKYPLGSGVKASGDYWQKEFKVTCGCGYPSGEAMYQTLDAYNNGKL